MYYVGLDLGQRQDHSAIAIVEKDKPNDEELTVRHIERIPLGTKYPAVVERVIAVLWGDELRGQCALAVDATGVGAPVVDMLRGARLGCDMAEITITGGDKETQRGPHAWSVPKRDLVAGLQVVLEQRDLKIAKSLREAGVLIEELLDMRLTLRGTGRIRVGADGYGQHDDLVIAVSLAVWLARRPKPRLNSWSGGGRLF